ncbi:exodeoxyribonuclease V subunit beta [Pseudoalteromonas sp. R3]|uniref:exodeoxyribonuclease V subunit beta n=1 Tax=Pseudoalteromonas sp. R3 TaxID=1709477 RepID=UPI0006B5A1D5|nr:exodeoxyribonuclease V subunit beta [Pseudoalteromonas sp. R3]AZZ97761.1 exodeoxyribonuclease V subunit beta [Pseudoalteromonas sp. R3]
MKRLDPQTMPLSGHNLIEASAGTGKTYTITGLYLRYLLGLVDSKTQSTPFSVEQILVVTFTEAATQEIKDRVRRRIVQARDALLGDECKDTLINELLAQVEDQESAYHLLDAAAKSMDEAAIFTIHGFCQRMLKQHAFESNLSFNLEFILDDSELFNAAVEDHWRRFVYPLDSDKTELVLSHFSHPQALAKRLYPILKRADAQLKPELDLASILDLRTQYQNQAVQFKQKLLNSDFFQVLRDAGLAKNKAPGRPANIQALIDYCMGEDWFFEFGTSKHSFALWGEAQLSDPKNYTKTGQPVIHPAVSWFDEMAQLHQSVSKGLPIALLQHALKEVRTLMSRSKLEHSLISPDDLLHDLHQALLGTQGKVLADKIAQLYPVAMIDEFQDTDPTQFGIFSCIYGSENGQGLTMIGDPKQAIYGFRGADIFTYIGAKHQVDQTRQFTLDKNYRSSRRVVSAVNTIFTTQPDSFIFNRDIPFIEVDAAGKDADNTFTLDGIEPPALQFNVFEDDEEPVTSKAKAYPILAQGFAAQIAQLLTLAQQGRACIGQRAVLAADICVLVRDRNEAREIKQALQSAGVSSVYLARDSVFSQPVAQAVWQLLHVVHGSYDEAALRGVLAGPLFALNEQQIYTLRTQEGQWQRYLMQFAQLKQLWYQQGAMATLESLLVDNQLVLLWQQAGFEVERWLTDYRHLAELLQHKQIELEGTQRVMRWLQSQCVNPNYEGTQLRLESDADLVKIVTMHASKGLEYPLVYMPFASAYRGLDDAIYHENGELVLNLDADEHAQQSAEQERLAEDIRLLYVALTRAIHYCSLGLYNLPLGRSKKPGIQQSALGYVLFGNEKVTQATQWHEQLRQLCAGNAEMAYQTLETVPCFYQPTLTEQTQNTHTRPVEVTIEHNWRMTSFSQLSYHEASAERPVGAQDENHKIDLPEPSVIKRHTPYTFVKGARAGSCLHEIFEQIDFTSPHAPASPDKLTLAEATLACLEKYHLDTVWQETVEHWILGCLNAPLNPIPELSLSQLAVVDCLVEMEFQLPLKRLSYTRLNKLIAQITGAPSHLRFDEVQGMLKGFIDLIFVWQGRYFILDYKSNYLGDTSADYQADNLALAMNSHQYHLQYLIYSVALHRLLKHRLADYSPQRHLGGVYYLFLRALPDGAGCFFTQLDESTLLQLDALFEAGEE